jgi:uncharacterized protein (TIGR02588 family)
VNRPREAASRPAPGAYQPIPAVEWLVAVLGLLLVVGAVAFLTVDALRGTDRPPIIVVRADTTVALEGGGWLVRFTAENRGRETAAEVGIAGELRDGADTETSRATLDYLPGRSSRRGGLFFRRDPRAATLELRAEGYRAP